MNKTELARFARSLMIKRNRALRLLSNIQSSDYSTTTVAENKPIKWNCVLLLLFNFQSSDYGAATVAKISSYSTLTRSTVSFD